MKKNKKHCCWLTLLCFTLLLGSCASKKSVLAPDADWSTVSPDVFMHGVVANAPDFDQFSAKMRLIVSYGDDDLSVGGSIKMKKDEVIQLSLVAVGIVEAARIELTPKRILLLDRIGRRYVEVKYDELDFLKSCKADFYTLQSLFWNELFLPGVKHVQAKDIDRFHFHRGDSLVTLSVDAGKRIAYNFFTALKNGQLDASTVQVESKRGADYRLDWSYGKFYSLENRMFPSVMNLSLAGTRNPMKASFIFSRWNTEVTYQPVKIPQRYKQVEVDEILKYLLNI